jgi:hypothetical protein
MGHCLEPTVPCRKSPGFRFGQTTRLCDCGGVAESMQERGVQQQGQSALIRDR